MVSELQPLGVIETSRQCAEHLEGKAGGQPLHPIFDLVEQILTHLGLPSEPLRASPAQPPPFAAADLVADALT